MSRRATALMAAACMAAVLLGGCKRRPLTTQDNNVIVSIDFDYDIVNYTVPADPEMMRVVFFNDDEGDFSSHAFTPARGGYASVMPMETYHVMAYNFDTESVVWYNEYDRDGITASTNEIPESYRSRLKSRATRYDDELIVFEPDHHFVANKPGTYVPIRSVGSAPVTIEMKASTIVETWKLYIDRIQGMEYVASVAGVISGLARAKTLADGEKTGETASVFFETLSMDSDGKVEVVFNTFGYLPAQRQIVTLVVTDLSGEGFEFDFDVSDQFLNNPEQIIRINTDKVIIDEPDTPGDGGGGLSPDIDDWEDIEADIEI